MTRIFTDGAEMRDVLFFTYTDTVTVTSTDPAPSPSSYCYRIANYAYKQISAISECYIRQRVNCQNAVAYSSNWRIVSFYSGATELAGLTFDGSGHLVAYTSAGNLESSDEILNSSQWYLLEIYFKLDDAAGRFEVYLDAVKVIDYTGDTKPGSQTTFDIINWKTGLTLGGGAIFGLDDLALNDTAGGVDDGYPGDGVIIKVTPDGNGTHQNWHGSDSDSVDNYLLVDEYPHDSDTTYVYHDGADSGTQDQYTLSDYDGTNKTILRIYPEARIRKTAAAAHTVKLGTLASGGSDEMSAAMNLSTSYARYVGDEQTVNPVDSNPWEEADIDALEFVVEVG